MSWTKRGTGTCPNCHKVYSTRWKPDVCSGCGHNIGGNARTTAKKPRLNQPGAVLIYDEGGEKLFSVNTSTRDDRCFVVEKGDEFYCGHKQCKDGRATFVASDKTKTFSCSHVVKCKAAISFECSYGLSVEKIEEYQGGDAAKQAISDTLKTRECGRPVVCKISDVNYVVLGPTSTNNTMQYAHVRNQNGKLVCCSKDSACNKIVAKGKYERAKNVCLHLHTLFCVRAFERIASLDDVAGVSSSASAVLQGRGEFKLLDCNQTQRENSIKLGAKQTVPYRIPPALLRQIDERNAGATLEWPKEFIPHQENCGLCGSPLGKPIKHSGSDGTATLITSSVCFRNVEIRVKVCSNKECKAINREQPYELGEYCTVYLLQYYTYDIIGGCNVSI